MAAGQVSEEQAVVIVKGVDALPVEHRRDAEAHLIGCAAEHDPVALRRLAHHVLEVVAPEIAEEHELKALQRQEALAEEACRFTIADDGHGLCHGRFTLPAPVGAMLKQAVLAINSPKHRHHSGTPKGLGHAFCEYVTRYPIDRLPQAGGVDATIVVTMTLENLLGDSQTPALLDTGDPITADQARKLACEAGIIPMVLGGKSKILDLGRSKRLYDLYQRIAIRHRDQHCTTHGCDWPAALCHVHHNTPWSRGGKTDLADGRLLCPRHHSYAHSPEVRDEDHPQRTRRLQPELTRSAGNGNRGTPPRRRWKRTCSACAPSTRHNASCADQGSGSSPSCQVAPKPIHTGAQSAATSQSPRCCMSSRRRIWNAWRGPSAQIGAVLTGQSRRSRPISSSSRSSSRRGSTSTVATFSWGARLTSSTLTRRTDLRQPPPGVAVRCARLAPWP